MNHFHQAFANKSLASIAAILSATLLATLPVKAQTTWVGSTGAWTSGTNWSGGSVPTSSDFATIDNGGTSQISSGTANASLLDVGFGGQGELQQSGGLLVVGNNLRVGVSGTGVLNVSGGLLSSGSSVIGASATGNGSATVSGGTWNTASTLSVGQTGTGSLLVSGGLVSTSVLLVGDNSIGVGTMTVSGGTTRTSSSVFIGRVGRGILNVNGGLFNTQAGTFEVGFQTSGTGVTNVSSGTLSVGGGAFNIGQVGHGTLNVTGGLVTTPLTITLGNSGGSSGTLNLSGGVVATTGLAENNGSGLINFNSGTLRALADKGDFLSGFEAGDVTINSGGAFIDSNGFAIGISTAFSGTGALTKLGAGTLTLSGSNSYTGGTTVKSGTLAVASGGSITHTGTNLTVGETSGDNGALWLNGGLVSAHASVLGSQAGSNGSATATSGTWINADILAVGYFGTGNLLINGGYVSSARSTISYAAGSSGQATVTSGTWAAGTLIIGGGSGSLLINGGYVSSSLTNIGYGTNAVGTATVTSGTWVSGKLSIGTLGTGTGSLLVNGGYVSSSSGYVGELAGSSGTATVTSGTWANAGNLFVGNSGTGSLNVTGGLVTGSNSTIGANAGAFGTATVAGGTWNTAALLEVGNDGTGLLNVNTGGYVSAQNVYIATGTGSTGTVNVNGGTLASSNNFIVGYRSTGTLNITNGQVSSQDFAIGNNPGSQGTVNLNAGGLLQNSAVAYVGLDGSVSGIMNVNGGTWTAGTINVGRNSPGVVTLNSGYISSGNANLGTSGTGNGTVNVNGGTWAYGTSFNVGNSGTGTLNLAGGLVSGSLVNLGNVAASTGSATVSGGTLAVASNLSVGSVATGNLLINGGSVITGGFVVGNLASSTGTATMTSGVLSSTNSGLFRVAESGRGTLVLNGGLISSNGAYIGTQAGSLGLATVNGGTWNSAGLTVGSSGTGTLQINGGLVSTGTSSTTIGNAASGVGSVTLAGGVLETGQIAENLGTGTLVFDSGTVRARANQANFFANFEAGDLTIAGGGAVIDSGTYAIGTSNVLSGSGALTKLGSGTFTLSGSNTYTGGTTISAGTLQIGNGSTTGSIAGNVVDNGTLAFNRSDNLAFGGIISGTGAVTKLGTNQLTLTGSNSYTGGTAIMSGNVVGNNANAFGTGAITMSISADTQVVLALTNNTTIANNILVSGSNAILTNFGTDAVSTFTGSITLLGGNLTVRGISGVGSTTVAGNISGTGNLTLLNGLSSNDTNSSVYVTGSVNNVGTITHTGTFSTASVTISGVIGSNVTGVIQNSDSSALLLTASNSYTGGTTISAGLLKLGDGSTLGASVGSGAVSIAGSGTFTLDLASGETFANTIADNGLLVVDDSPIANYTVSSNISGTGRLSKEGGNTVTLTGSNSYTGTTTISGGTLQIGNGGTAGTLGTAAVVDDSMLVFNRSDVVTVANNISGAGQFNQAGSGTTVLTGRGSYTGTTSVSGGKLVVNGALSGSPVAVGSGAALGGSGTITGTVMVANGGIVSPGNSPGNLTVGTLNLSNVSQLNYDLGAPQPPGVAGVDSDLITVTNNLTLDGILNMVTSGSFGTGTYTLMNYGGTLVNNDLAFGLAPAGYNLTIDTSTAGQVKLTADYTGLQFWDGTQTTPDGTVHGGDGTWDAATTNWTNEFGTANTAWAGLTAVFSNTGGTVNVTGTQSVAGVQFSGDGYILSGTGALLVSGSATEIRIDPTLHAEIATEITGTGGILKTGGGQVLLSAANTYSGNTTLNAGALRIGDDQALGTGTLIINGGTIGNGEADSFYAPTNNIQANADFGVYVKGSHGGLEMEGNLALGTGTRTITFTGDGLACFGGIISGENLNLVAGNPISEVQFCGADSNTFTGTMTVGTGVEITLAKDPGAVAVSGDLVIDEDGFVRLGGDNQIASTSKVVLNGVINAWDASEQEINVLTGTGIYGSTDTNSTLTVHSGTFDGLLTEHGDALALVKTGPGTFALTGSNNYTGGTTINAGTLVTTNADALGSGGVVLHGGTLAPAGHIRMDTLTWDGGTVASILGTQTSVLDIANELTVSGTGGAWTFAAGTGFTINKLYLIASSSNLDSLDPSLFTGNDLFGLHAKFIISGTNLYADYEGSVIATGPLLQNSAPVGTPDFADFVVSGSARTGGPTDDNTINGLIFKPSGILTVFNNLFVTSGSFTVNSGTGTIGGPGTVITPGDFTKVGQGLLKLLGNVFANGNTNLNGGTLSVDGTLTTNELIVALNTFLKGHGVIFGNVLNNGHVAPGNSPGTLTINGNYTQSKSGALDIEIASTSLFDQLIVNGHVSLAGTLNFIKYGGFKFKYGQQFKFLQADSISGHFDHVNMPGHFRARLLEKHGDLTLVAAPKSYVQVAETQNQKNVARALNSFIKATHGDKEKVSIALDKQSKGEYPTAFNAIAPTFYESLGTTTIELANAQNQILSQRMSAVRLGVRGFSAVGMQMVLANDKDGKSVMDAKGEKDILKITPDTKWGVWVQGNGIFAKVASIGDVPNYRYQSGGFTVGADYAWNEHLSTGLFTGYQGTYAKYGNGGVNTVNSALFGGYATYAQDGFYGDAIVGGSYNGYTARRPIEFSSINRTATSNPNGGQFNTYLDAGYDWHVNKFTFGPLVSGQYTYAGIAPFTEQGAKSLDLRVNEQNVNSLRTNIGGRIAYTWNLTDQIMLIPEVRMSWQHEFLNNSRSIGASLDGGAGPSFNYQTANPGRDSVLATAGISAQFGQRWNGNFYYTADFGNQSFISHMISAGLEWKF